jgi:hypothetical protein
MQFPRRANTHWLLHLGTRWMVQPISQRQVLPSRHFLFSRNCPLCIMTAGSPAMRRMCGLTSPSCGMALRCGQCGLTSTRTNVCVALWLCPMAVYQCVAYVGCSLSNGATHDLELLSSNEHSMCFLPLNSSRHPAPIGMPSGGSA